MADWSTVFFFLTFINFVSRTVVADPLAPCYFVFGDSLADPGNNNNFNTIAKANYAPYGVDFPGGIPTGRFTNGRTYVDFIAQSLGFTQFVPPIAGAEFIPDLFGVNYASGAAGILEETGKTNGDRISLGNQLSTHAYIVGKLPTIWKTTKEDVASRLNKCIYTIGIGSNDYVNNYFLPKSYSSSATYDPQAFAKLLIGEHNRIIKALYDLGARKMAFVGVGHIGFTPYELKLQNPGPENAAKLNSAVDLFNTELKASVGTLASALPGAKLTYLNTVGITSEGPPVSPAAITSCCQNIDSVSQVTCAKGDSSICDDRSKSLFFDNIHPTEVVNQAISARYFAAKDPSDVSPYDIQTLATL